MVCFQLMLIKTFILSDNPSQDDRWGQPLSTNIISEYFCLEIVTAATLLSQELLLVAWLLTTHLFAVSLGGKTPAFKKKYISPQALREGDG